MEYLPRTHPELASLVPTTVILQEGLPQDDPYCWKEITRGEAFILKRRRSFSGRHVVMGPEVVRQLAPRLLREEPGQWVAQERVSLARYPFAVVSNGSLRVGVFPFTADPFGWSCFVRVGIGDPWGPINAHRGSAKGEKPDHLQEKDVRIDLDAPHTFPILEESKGLSTIRQALSPRGKGSEIQPLAAYPVCPGIFKKAAFRHGPERAEGHS